MLVIQVWMNQNMLKLVFMIIGNLTQRKKVAHIFPVELLNQNVAEIDAIRAWVWLLIQLFHSRNVSGLFVDQLSSIFEILNAFEFFWIKLLKFL